MNRLPTSDRRTIDLDALDRTDRGFSRSERRWIHSRITWPLERAFRSMRRAFEVFGSAADDLPETWTLFIAAITPMRLESRLADLDRLGQFWHAQWRASTGERARVAKRAYEHLTQARSAIESWLQEIEPAIIEQHRRGMRADILLPKRDRERFRTLDQPALQPILADERRDLLRRLRDAVRPHGGVVNQQVLNQLFDLAERDDPEALAALKKIRETLRAA